MLQHYLKIAFRNILKNKTVSLINFTGLAFSIAVGLVIMMYVNFEASYDTFHPQKDRIYRVVADKYQEGELYTEDAFTVPALGPVLKAEVPGIADYFRLTQWADNYTFLGDGNSPVTFKAENAAFADMTFLQYFATSMLAGNKETALAEPGRFIMSAGMARKVFGPKWEALSPVGKTFSVYTSNRDQTIAVTLSGIYEDIPENSHLDYSLLFSHTTLPNFLPSEIPEEQRLAMFETMWGPPSWYTYIVTEGDVDAVAFSEKISSHLMKRNNMEEASREEYHLQPLASIHLNSSRRNEAGVNGDLQQLYILMGVALLIIVVACINYINLSSAIGLGRIKEIAVRRYTGAEKYMVLQQFAIEALVFMTAGLLVAVLLVGLARPFLQEWVSATVIFQANRFWWFGIGLFLLLLLGSSVTVGYVASLFAGPAVLNTRSGRVKTPATGKVLVTVQLAVALVLIAGAWTIYRQVNFLRQQELGIQTDQVLVLENPNVLDASFSKKVDELRNRLAAYPGIKTVAATNTVPGTGSKAYVQMSRQGQDDSKSVKDIRTDNQYLQLLGVQPVAGQLFYENPGLNKGKVVLNRQAVQALGFASPEVAIGEKVEIQSAWGKQAFEVLGVAEDFHQVSLKQPFEPIAFFGDISIGSVLVNFAPVAQGGISEQMAQIEQEWQTVFADNPFNFFFLDEFFDRQYAADQQFGKIFNLFAGLAIIISGMGILGLTIGMLARRLKEISIRKVLGASVPQLFILLIKDFGKIMLVALLLAAPVAWWLVSYWLEGYPARITPGPLTIVVPAVVLAASCLLFVSLQIWKVAVLRPVDTLRNE